MFVGEGKNCGCGESGRLRINTQHQHYFFGRDELRRVAAVSFALFLLAATSSSASAQHSIYMLVDSIRGDQTSPHDREFRLNSYSSGIENSVTLGSTGTTTAKAVFSPVKVSMRFHATSSPSFARIVTTGTKLSSIEIRMYNATNRMFYKTVYENVHLTSVVTEGSDESQQEISFVYGRVRWFAPTDPAGLTPPVSVGCWDQALNRGC